MPSRAIGSPAQKIVTSLGDVDLSAREITNSARSTLLTCRRKFALSYGHRLRRRGVVDYFWIGGQFHKELEIMYENRAFDRKRMAARVREAAGEAMALAADDGQRAKIQVAHATLMGMVPVYADLYLEQDLRRFKIAATEQALEREIPGTKWTYRGKTDMVVDLARLKDPWGERGTRGMVENKTTGQMDANYFARLPLDHQILGYVWLLEPHWGRMGFIVYNVAQKSRLRQKNGESFNQFCARIEEDYRLDPTKYFYREKVEFSWKTVKAFVGELVDFVGEVEFHQKRGIWGMATNQCTIRGACEFLRLCIEGPSRDVLMEYSRREHAHEELDGDE